MENFIGDTIGLIHVIASVFALILGTITLVLKKGSPLHIKIGYGYVSSMVLLLSTAFMIYRLFNGFGIFHITAIISLTTLILGIIPVYYRKSSKWLYLHFTFMYWSVMGLYAAFAAELLVRIPNVPFYGMIGVATAIIMLLGGLIFGFKKKKWKKEFAIVTEKSNTLNPA